TIGSQQSAVLLYGFNPSTAGAKRAAATLTRAGGSGSVPPARAAGAPPPPPPRPPAAPRAAAPKPPAGRPRTRGGGGARAREAAGPAVPLSKAETAAFATRVPVAGFTAAAITDACQKAVATGVQTVYLPAGSYSLEEPVSVPGSLCLVGAGAGTVLSAPRY